MYFIDASKKYELESIAFTDEPVISLQQVINCTEVNQEQPEKIYFRYFSEEDYRYSLKFTDGTVFDTISTADGEGAPLSVVNEFISGDPNDDYIYVRSYLLYDECVRALEENADEIPVHFYVDARNKMGDYVIAEDYTVTVKADTEKTTEK